MIRFLNFFIIAVCLVSFSSSSFAKRNYYSTLNRFVPKDGYTLLFCGQNNRDCDEFVKINKNIPAGFMFYTSIADLTDLETDTDFGSGKMSGKHFLKKYKGASLQIGLYLINMLHLVVNGVFDENIKKLGEWIKQTRVPVFLRIGYEFDLLENKYDPELYKEAFRYIVEKLDEQGVTNVAYVWHSCASFNSNKLENWYPGDEYVDWCAVSYFSKPQWIPMLKFAQNHKKPLMIAESAPLLDRDLTKENKIKWYETLFKFIENNNIKAVGYINANWDAQPMFSKMSWGNSKLNNKKEVKDLWLKKISSERFVNLDRLKDDIYMGLKTVNSVLASLEEQKAEQEEVEEIEEQEESASNEDSSEE